METNGKQVGSRQDDGMQDAWNEERKTGRARERLRNAVRAAPTQRAPAASALDSWMARDARGTGPGQAMCLNLPKGFRMSRKRGAGWTNSAELQHDSRGLPR